VQLKSAQALSEHEQRQLEQIEQAPYAEHPRFAKAVRAADPQVHYPLALPQHDRVVGGLPRRADASVSDRPPQRSGTGGQP